LRTIRAALSALGFKEDMLRHGIKREVFISRLAANATSILRTGEGEPDTESLLCAKEIAERGIERWMRPRAERRPEYRDWSLDDLMRLFGSQSHLLRSQMSNSGRTRIAATRA
jgi:hypothetical protein